MMKRRELCRGGDVESVRKRKRAVERMRDWIEKRR
jgi:hypothetical protein